MHFLRISAKPDVLSAEHFVVQWTNTVMTARTPLRVFVPLDMDDRDIIAELYALQYLLEVKEVLGNNQAGNADIKLIVSRGAIRKLCRKESAKKGLIEYAKFLTTRFRGCVLEVDKDEQWFTSEAPEITLDASTPSPETIHVYGLGKVDLSSHVVDQFADRMQIDAARLGEAWRALRRIASDDRVKEIQKNRIATRMKYSRMGRDEGRYFYHPAKHVMMVVANDAKSKPRLVTVYKVQWQEKQDRGAMPFKPPVGRLLTGNT